ncbi:NTP transferase domain-containing protein [bacterium]|nr:NTP transferase domain-containing protein [bacterium]
MPIPTTAMVFAAGLGTRMRSHRDDIPKPLVPVAGRPIIDHVLDRLVAGGVKTAVVNVSWMGDLIKSHLAKRTDIVIRISEEDAPLETGGGIVKALPLLGDGHIYVINSDIIWIDGATPALQRLAEHFDPTAMDALLLACPTSKATGYTGKGDLVLDQSGAVRLRQPQEIAPYVFGGVQLLNLELFKPYRDQTPTPVFSLNRFFTTDEKTGWMHRIHALAHDSIWMHIGDGDGVKQAEEFLGQ